MNALIVEIPIPVSGKIISITSNHPDDDLKGKIVVEIEECDFALSLMMITPNYGFCADI